MRLSILFYLIIFFLTSPFAFAGSNGIDNGGELLSSRFVNIGKAVFETLSRENADLLTAEEMKSFRNSLFLTRINAIPGPLKDNRGRLVDARYIHTEEHPVIELDQTRWEGFFANHELLNQLVFHEYLRTIHVDDDNYKVSAKLSPFSRAIDEVAGSTSDGKLIVNEPSQDFIFKDSSGANRNAKTFTLMGGFGVDYASASFVKADYFWDRNEQVEFFFSGSDNGIGTTLSHQSISYKEFSSNSFYWAGGVGTRRFIYERVIAGKNESYTQSDITAELYFGNQWQWQHFTLATDWFGASLPIALLRQTGDGNRYNGSIIFMRFSIGASF